ncbi:MAG: T9SS type A sorting domain-containing protein [Bacteroidetes bacterium]|nr:T9SS type A sorting domain-containing protein [Bacteroidota bacterium]
MKKLLLICFLHIFFISRAQNDDCSTAQLVISGTNCASPTAGNSSTATQSMPGCTGNADDDVWYKFVASSPSHSVVVSTSSGYDAVLETFTGNCSSLNSVDCNDNSGMGGIESSHMTGLTPGQTYYFRVYEYHAGYGSATFTVCVLDAPPPANDDCANATPVTVSTTTNCSSPLLGYSYGASQSLPGCTGTADDDVWYTFTASATSHSVTVSEPPGYDAVVEIFSGTCGSLTSMHCIDQAGSGGVETIHLGGLSAGTTYYMRVYDYYTGGSPSNFTICITTPSVQPPSNDDCNGAITLTVTPPCTPSYGYFNTIGATESMPDCAGSSEDDVWGQFIATNSHVDIVAVSAADAVIELFDGNCGNLTSIGCRDYYAAGIADTLKAAGLNVGQTYYFRVYDYYTVPSTFTVNVITHELLASASSGTVCLGAQVVLTATGTPSVSWSNGIGNGTPFTPTVSASYTATGTGTGGCVNTAVVNVFVTSTETPDICMITVDTANTNNVVYWEKSYNAVDSFIVYREVLANTYHRIGAVSSSAFSRFVDTVRSAGPRNGDPHVRSYKYKLQIRDTCGNYGSLSNYHTSLFLNNTGSAFSWNFYDIETQPSPVNNYYIYRDDLNNGNFVQIGTVAGTVNTFTDAAYSSFPNAKWAVFADGFSCTPSYKTANIATTIVRSKSNVKNNLTIPDPPSDSVLTAGIQVFDGNFNTLLMPNPATSYVEIRSGQELQKVNIYNTLGELVYTTEAHHQTYLYIRTEELRNGLYHVEFVADKARAIRKLIINR